MSPNEDLEQIEERRKKALDLIREWMDELEEEEPERDKDHESDKAPPT